MLISFKIHGLSLIYCICKYKVKMQNNHIVIIIKNIFQDYLFISIWYCEYLRNHPSILSSSLFS